MHEEERNLTDDDVKALADELEKRLENLVYSNLGRGLLSLAWKGIVVAVLGIAAYGGIKGIK